MSFHSGKVDRKYLPKQLHRFCPAETVESIFDLDPSVFSAQGKKLILLDLDNTLVPWRSEVIPEEAQNWLDSARKAGLELCIISNTRHPARLLRLSHTLGLRALYGKFKPNRRMFLQAMKEFDATPEETVMIGDQLFTDIWGANRCGIDAIWVRQMTPHDFIGTKVVSRNAERFVKWLIFRAIRKVAEIEKARNST